jgi:hypothetical protein
MRFVAENTGFHNPKYRLVSCLAPPAAREDARPTYAIPGWFTVLAFDVNFRLFHAHMNRILSLATNLFPVWVLLGGALALVQPGWFAWFSGDFITWGLAVIMLGMGIWRLRPPSPRSGATSR